MEKNTVSEEFDTAAKRQNPIKISPTVASLSLDEFPELSSSQKRPSKTVENFTSIIDNESVLEQNRKQAAGLLKLKNKHDLLVKKNPKRKDPISLNILDLVKEQPQKLSTFNKNGKFCKVGDRSSYGGNLLDSSKPPRNRGKHREIPKRKRLTKLKFAILHGRNYRRNNISSNSLNAAIPSSSKVGNSESLSQTEVENGVNEIHNTLGDYQEKIYSFQNINDEDRGTNISEIAVEGYQENKNVIVAIQEAKNDLKLCAAEAKDKLEVASAASKCDTELKNVDAIVKSHMHTRKFRLYCENICTPDLNNAVISLIKELHRFQDRLYQRDPIRARAKRRFVLGFREVKKYLFLRKMHVIIIAPDLEHTPSSPGGIDDTISVIKNESNALNIPVIFAADRRKIGRALIKSAPISIIGILNFEGAENLHSEVIQKWNKAIIDYQSEFQSIKLSLFPELSAEQIMERECSNNSDENDVNIEVVESLLSKFRDAILE